MRADSARIGLLGFQLPFGCFEGIADCHHHIAVFASVVFHAGDRDILAAGQGNVKGDMGQIAGLPPAGAALYHDLARNHAWKVRFQCFDFLVDTATDAVGRFE